MNRRWLVLAGTLAIWVAIVARSAGASEPQTGGQGRPPAVRMTVEMIPVDVQVIDRHGQPVAGLEREKFTVTIDGRRRRVVSAEFIQSRSSSASPGVLSSATGGGGQVMMLAIDCMSFSPDVVLGAVAAVRGFIKRLPPDTLVGLFAYPSGPDIDPTADREAVIRALDSVVGQRDLGTVSQFRLRPSEIIDISTELPEEDGPILSAVARRECGDPIDRFCLKRLILDISSTALYYEAQANVSLGGVRSLLNKLAAFSGRKTLVLISGGLVSSDRPGGRPDLAGLGTEAGKEAARANTAIYTLNIDTAFQERYMAGTRTIARDLTNIGRDGAVRARWLGEFSGAAGGALFTVLTDSGEYAFNRILTETSSYYLLGVEPLDADRNGLTQEIKVNVALRDVTVRSRRWVSIPKRGGTAPAVSVAPSSPSPMPATFPAPVPVAPRPLPADVQPIADAFERGDYLGMQKQLTAKRDLADVILAFRTADAPWPETPRLAAVFALELATAGLRSENGFARDQGARLLAEYNTRVRQPLAADLFECTWLWAEAAALGSLLRPGAAIGFVSRALLRCPDEPRLHLADAIITEQWLSAREPTAAEASDVMRRYETAMMFPETALEARVRGAAFLLRAGKADLALELLYRAADRSVDGYVQYLADLIRGRALAALGRFDDAIAALRAALITWPGAQSARVALMALLFQRGNREEAASLAEAVETATDEAFDPWWTYHFGDFRAYPTIIARLRELAH